MDRIPPGTTPPTTPAYLSRAYAPTPALPQSVARAPTSDGTIARIGPDAFESTVRATPTTSAAKAAPSKAASLVAARVPTGIDFSVADAPATSKPQTASQTIPLYRHPADRNTVATAVHAGRILDVNG